MSWGMVAVAGATLVGGVISSSAAKSAGESQAGAARSAADAQLTASREANLQQLGMYQQNLSNQAPSMQAGQSALAALQSGLGLGQLRASPGASPGQPGIAGGQPQGTYVNAQGEPTDTAGNVISTSGPAAAMNYGATQADLNQAAGSVESGQLTRGLGTDFTTDPSYQWRLAQGMKTLQASAAARGGLLTGQGGIDLQNYGQGAASQEYQAAYDRNRSTQNDLYNRLAGLAGIGQVATGAIGAAGANAANQMGANTIGAAGAASGYLTSGAAATAAGSVGQANAWNSALNNGVQNWQTMQYLKGNQWTPPVGQGSNPGGYNGTYNNPSAYVGP